MKLIIRIVILNSIYSEFQKYPNWAFLALESLNDSFLVVGALRCELSAALIFWVTDSHTSHYSWLPSPSNDSRHVFTGFLSNSKRQLNLGALLGDHVTGWRSWAVAGLGDLSLSMSYPSFPEPEPG
jgi:hypothetical protein